MDSAAERTIEHETLPPGSAKSFTWFLSRIGDGSLVHELTHKMTEIGAALNQHYQDFRGKPKAEITIKIKIINDKGVMHVTGGYDIKLPGVPVAGAILWTDRNNNFTEDNPEQLRLFAAGRGPRAV
ncbi:MAG TPA: hypothetical protein VNX86_04620 [Rhizomicrobium sp.]|nr:hypothetical protein [Rhizomicrobium sp.]